MIYSEEFNITNKLTFAFKAYQSDDQTFYLNITTNRSTTSPNNIA